VRCCLGNNSSYLKYTTATRNGEVWEEISGEIRAAKATSG